MSARASRFVLPLVGLMVAAGAVAWFLWERSRPTPAERDESDLTGVSVADLRAAHPPDRQLLAKAADLARGNRPQEAIRELNKLERKDDGPVHLRAVVLTGKCLLRVGRIGEAERVFGYVLDRRPDDPDAHRGLAAVYDDLGAVTEAERHLRRVAELDSTDYRPWRLLALRAVELKEFPTAEEAARAALDRNPPAAVAAEVRRDLAAALVGLTRYSDALAVCPDDPHPVARAVRAECLRTLGRAAEAEREIADGLVKDPANDRLLMERGLLAVDRKDDAAAVEAFEKVLSANEHHKAARYQAMLACQRLGRTELAERHAAKLKDTEAKLARVTDLNAQAIARPRDAAVRRELAEACRKINRPDLAAMWERAAVAAD